MQILVVDDHPVFLSGVEYLLSSRRPEYRVDAINDPREVASRLRWSRYDLLLLDMNLPHMAGLEVLSQLKTSAPDINVLLMSAETNVGKVKRGLEAGACGFLPKSADHHTMLTAIDSCSRGHTFLPDELTKMLSTTTAHTNGNVTPRQVSVLELVAKGLSNKEIASELNLTEYTVKSHMRSIFNALDCKNRTACVREAQERGILSA